MSKHIFVLLYKVNVGKMNVGKINEQVKWAVK